MSASGSKTKGRIRGFFAELRPSAITGGAPFFPLLVLFGLNAVDELDRSAFGILTPEIRDHFGLNFEGILTLAAIVAVPIILLEIPIAFAADRFSRTRIATAGAATWSMFSVLTGLAPNVAVLGVARAGSGIGQAVNGPTHNSLISDYYDVSQRVKVYGFHRAANSLGQILGPALAGVLAFYFSWRTPFVVFAVPTAILVVLAWRLRDPIRGAPERRAMGAAREIVDTEEEAPGMAESWRLLWQVRTLRRIWLATPFLAASLIGAGSLFALYYEEVFGLNEIERGVIAAVGEPFQLVGLALGIPFAYRMAARGPSFLVKLLAGGAVVQAALFVFLVIAPSLVVAIPSGILISTVGAVVGPGIFAALSLAIPPRARSLGFSIGGVFVLPGLIVLPIIGRVADDVGLRPAMLVMVPVYLVGSFIIASAGNFIGADIQRIRSGALARSEVMLARRENRVKLLVVKDLDVRYDGVQVLFGVDFEVDEGEIVALLGTNGAGKSTLLKAVSGLVDATAGVVIFDGRDCTDLPPNDLASRGVIQVPGGRGIFPSLSVEENLRIAGWLHRSDKDYVDAKIEEVFGYFPVLRERLAEEAGSLSGGEQQMLTLGQAFIAKPRLLMIDELSLGLAPIVVEKLLAIVEAIRKQGTTVILVEQSVNIALSVAEKAYFMEKGQIRFSGPARELLRRPDLLRSVFLKGASSDGPRNGGRRRVSSRARAKKPAATGMPVLEAGSITKSFGGVQAVDEVSLSVGEKQILGVIGPNGAGKTTVFDILSGFITPEAGTVVLGGRDITSMSPDARSRLGLGRSFQDARLFAGLTVHEAIAVALDRSVQGTDPIAEALSLPAVGKINARVRSRVLEIVEQTGLTAFHDKFVSELSTGSRRIVEIACALAHEPRVLMLDEPSSGIAQREVEALGEVLADIPKTVGAAVLLIEHDMPLITAVSDELIAMDLGRVIARGTPGRVVKDDSVVASYLGGSARAIARSGRTTSRGRPSKRSRPGKAGVR